MRNPKPGQLITSRPGSGCAYDLARAEVGLAALGAGFALGACAVVAVALPGRADQANVGGLCLAPSPVRALAAPGRPCDRLALNLVTLPCLPGNVAVTLRGERF